MVAGADGDPGPSAHFLAEVDSSPGNGSATIRLLRVVEEAAWESVSSGKSATHCSVQVAGLLWWSGLNMCFRVARIDPPVPWLGNDCSNLEPQLPPRSEFYLIYKQALYLNPQTQWARGCPGPSGPCVPSAVVEASNPAHVSAALRPAAASVARARPATPRSALVSLGHQSF